MTIANDRLQEAWTTYMQLLSLTPEIERPASLDEHLENVLKIKEWLKENDK